MAGNAEPKLWQVIIPTPVLNERAMVLPNKFRPMCM